MILVYLSPVKWDSIAQRPHFFANFIAEQNVEKLIWVEPLPSRFPKYSDIRTKIIGVESSSILRNKTIDIVKPKGILPVEPFPNAYKILNAIAIKKFINKLSKIIENDEAILVVGKPSILSLMLLEKITFKKIIVDVMDDYPHFFKGFARGSVRNLLIKILSNSDLSMFSSSALLKKYNTFTSEAVLVKNACSNSYCQMLENVRFVRNSNSSDIITYGYVGSVASWFDWNFINTLSLNRPNAKIVIVGPLYIKPDYLPDNVIIKPAIDHKEIPQIMKTFTYGIIPFKINQLTESVDPVKYYEYIASGLPVISTSFGEMKYRIDAKLAVTLEQHLSGIEPMIEKPIMWEDRFKFLLERVCLC